MYYLKQMKDHGVVSTERTYASILDCCAKLDAPNLVNKYFEIMREEGHRISVEIINIILKSYSRSGDTDSIMKLLQLMKEIEIE